MREVLICDYIRTPIGRYGGALAGVRADDLAAIPIRELLARNRGLDPSQIDDVLMGCANQAGEAHCIVAGGVGSMGRAPFVMPKAESAFSRRGEVFDTTIGCASAWGKVSRLQLKQFERA